MTKNNFYDTDCLFLIYASECPVSQKKSSPHTTHKFYFWI